MSDVPRAVFLSYASQDAEAARRICEALRAAGIEVWFDQNELVGGDAWDAKIRRQIKECALFVPIISANTNARAEGYFRLEWKLAVDRSHLMADDAPFLFPVVIDNTSDTAARVPDKFREMQWTRLNVKDTPETLAKRVARLLGGSSGMEAGRPRPTERGEGAASPAKANPKWLRYVAVIGGLTIGLVYAFRPLWSPPRHAETKPPAAVSVVAPLSEARQLTQRARALLDKIDSTADDFAVAESLAKRAIELDPTDGETWAVSSRINSAYLSRNFERSDARREAARSQAERAVKLAPDSPEAWLALGRGVQGTDIARSEEAIRQGLKLAPNDGRLLLTLAGSYRRQNRYDEAMAEYEQAAAQPDARPLARYDQYLIHFYFRRFADADRCIREAIALVPTTNMVAGLAMLEVTWQGQVAEARRMLAAAPAVVRSQPRVVLTTALVSLMANEPNEALRALDRLPADYINDAWFTGPKGLLTGLAHAQAGSREAARLAWESGLTVAKKSLQEAPNDPEVHLRYGELLGWLGQTEAALQEAHVFDELRRRRTTDWTYSAARIYAAVGRADLAVPLLKELLEAPPSSRWPLTRALMRVDPLWGKLQGDPGFEALCAEPAATTAAPDDKSVAVLAFANLSDDKANEYFSDGISEELLNVLAKVPKLKVAARTSSFYFKGRNEPIPEIAQKLGVAYVVEGSVRKSGNKVRITAQLIKAADGFHVWSETYDRELKDIFAVQDEIAKNILGVVKGSLLGEAELPHATTTNIEAYTLFLQGQAAFARRGDAGLREAIRLFEAALTIDPDYVPALVGLAQSRVLVPIYANLSGAKAREMIDSATSAAQRALALDPRNATAHAALGWALIQYQWRWSEGEKMMLRARDLAPNDAWIWNSLGDYYRFVCDFPKALEAKQREWSLDPLSPVGHWDLAYTYQVAGDYEQTLHWVELTVALAPHNLDAYFPAIMAAGQAGRMDVMRQMLTAARRNVHENEGMLLMLEARAAIWEKKPEDARRILAAVITLVESGDASPAYLGYCYLLLGDSAQAAIWLRKAIAQHDAVLVWTELIDFNVIAAELATRPILDEPRIKELYELRQQNARAGRNKL